VHRRTHYSLSLIKPVSYQTVLHRGAEVMHGKATTKTDDACFSWHFTTPTSSRDVRVGVRVGVVECQLYVTAPSDEFQFVWLGGVTVRPLDLRLRGRVFATSGYFVR